MDRSADAGLGEAEALDAALEVAEEWRMRLDELDNLDQGKED